MRNPADAPELARMAESERLPIHIAAMDAELFLQRRAYMTDEQWVDWGAADDATRYQSVERDFRLDARLPE